MSNFLSKKENQISKKFEKNGFIIFDLNEKRFLNQLIKFYLII